jgi:predicted dienelactone hydrolase
MRLFEFLMLLVILPVLAWPFLPWPRPRWVDFLPATAVLLMIAQLVAEGYRWQMLPAYALVVIVFLVTLPRLRSPSLPQKKWSGWAITAGALGFLAWLAALALPYLLPVPRLPDVSGPYAIGTQTVHLVDESRDEIYTDDADDRREIMLQVWYPAEPDARGDPAVYLQELDVMGPTLAKRLDLPSFLLDHVNLADLDAQIAVPVLADGAPYPLLVFSHGLRGMRAQNTALVRELVSHGFVVATIDHTFGNVLTVFPDRRVAFYSPDVLSGAGEPPHTSNTLVGVWADDIGTVLDQLALWNETQGNEFFARLDLSKVGVFGHSTGGGATVEFCGRDDRCRAGVGLDAWLVPVSDQIVAAGLAQPFLFLQADQWQFDDAVQNEARARALLEGLSETGYLAAIEGAAHYDFSDMPLFSPLTPQLGLSSDMDSYYVVDMVTSMTAAFFRQELKEEGDNLVLGALTYPEMSLLGNGQ